MIALLFVLGGGVSPYPIGADVAGDAVGRPSEEEEVGGSQWNF